MSEAFTFDGVQTDDLNSFDDLPPGTYTCVIEECVSGTSKNGTPELRVQFRVQTGEHKNRVISDWLYFNSNTVELIATKLLAAGVQLPSGIKTADQAPARVSGIIHGKYVDIVVREDTYNGETRTKVRGWKKPPESLQVAPSGNAIAPDDDSIPF